MRWNKIHGKVGRLTPRRSRWFPTEEIAQWINQGDPARFTLLHNVLGRQPTGGLGPFAQQGLACPARARAHTSSPLLNMTGCTSMAMFNGFPPGPGAAEARAASPRARSSVSTSMAQ